MNRLHFGAGCVARLPVAVAEIFLRPGWVHLGDKQELPDAWRGRVTPWFWKYDDKLAFPDGHFHFVFSEHVFEHFFLDEAAALFRECFRVMAAGAVIRTVVPDADLRPEPEPLDYLGIGHPFSGNDPRRHKTRWNIYALGWLLEETGFHVKPLRYYHKEGGLIERQPELMYREKDARCDPEMSRSLAYVIRPDSLIVDGMKPC